MFLGLKPLYFIFQGIKPLYFISVQILYQPWIWTVHPTFVMSVPIFIETPVHRIVRKLNKPSGYIPKKKFDLLEFQKKNQN